MDPGALAVARRNGARLGLARRVEFVLSDLFADVGERPFDLIVSNPPYIPADEYVALEPNVRDYEPRLALYGGVDGLDFYRRLIPGAALLLRPGGTLALEVGAGQADDVAGIVDAARAYEAPERRSDLSGVPRVVFARRRGARAAPDGARREGPRRRPELAAAGRGRPHRPPLHARARPRGRRRQGRAQDDVALGRPPGAVQRLRPGAAPGQVAVHGDAGAAGGRLRRGCAPTARG